MRAQTTGRNFVHTQLRVFCSFSFVSGLRAGHARRWCPMAAAQNFETRAAQAFLGWMPKPAPFSLPRNADVSWFPASIGQIMTVEVIAEARSTWAIAREHGIRNIQKMLGGAAGSASRGSTMFARNLQQPFKLWEHSLRGISSIREMMRHRAAETIAWSEALSERMMTRARPRTRLDTAALQNATGYHGSASGTDARRTRPCLTRHFIETSPGSTHSTARRNSSGTHAPAQPQPFAHHAESARWRKTDFSPNRAMGCCRFRMQLDQRLIVVA